MLNTEPASLPSLHIVLVCIVRVKLVQRICPNLPFKMESTTHHHRQLRAIKHRPARESVGGVFLSGSESRACEVGRMCLACLCFSGKVVNMGQRGLEKAALTPGTAGEMESMEAPNHPYYPLSRSPESGTGRRQAGGCEPCCPSLPPRLTPPYTNSTAPSSLPEGLDHLAQP